MSERGQFTFYRSFWEAIRGLPKKDRLPILEAIISYALDGKAPKGLSPTQSGYFLLIRPNLDASRKRAASGKQGGSKPKAKGKQTQRESEVEKENEIEIEGEIEKKQTAPQDGKLFTAFWESYPDKCNRDAAWEAWKKLNPDGDLAGKIMTSLDAWKKSARWKDQGGKFIPRAAKWLSEGHWQNIPAQAQEERQNTGWQLGEAEMQAVQDMMNGSTAQRLFSEHREDDP